MDRLSGLEDVNAGLHLREDAVSMEMMKSRCLSYLLYMMIIAASHTWKY